ncbi:MAG: hypothetical protein WA005_19955 [Candidatus Binataceae bacterium]
MEKSLIKNSLGQIERELEDARDARRQLEAEDLDGESRGGWGDARGVLRFSLDRVYEILSVILEAGGLADTRTHLVEKWRAFEKKPEGLGATTFLADVEYLESEPLTYVDTILISLRAVIGEGPNSAEAHELGKLESILRRTAWLVRNRGKIPKREMDVQEVMHDYLGAFFTEYTRKISLPKLIKNFKPDGGVRDLKVAIEFKYAASEREVSEALSGIYKDMAGYSGSADWTRFYTVLYQTEAFVSEDRFRTAVSRGGSNVWTPILVTGSGERKARNPRKK